MAKLAEQAFFHQNETGDVFRYDAPVTVTTDGLFHVSLHEDLQALASKLVRAQAKVHLTATPSKRLRVSGPALKDCVAFIHTLIRDHMACVIDEALVIVYGTNIQVAYVKDRDGQFYENGSVAREAFDRGDATWHGRPTPTMPTPFYTVGLAARVMRRTIYTRPSGTTTKFGHVQDEDLAAWGRHLNGFCSLSLPTHQGSRTMPYTEAAARFFFESMLSLCRLADRMETFFGDETVLLDAIDRQLRLTGPVDAPGSAD